MDLSDIINKHLSRYLMDVKLNERERCLEIIGRLHADIFKHGIDSPGMTAAQLGALDQAAGMIRGE